MPWHSHGVARLLNARNATTGTPYRGSNCVALFLDAVERGFPISDYATFNQYRKIGAKVRKGERAAFIIKWVTPKNRNDTEPVKGQPVQRRLVSKVYAVFNAHQVNGREPQPEPATGTRADKWLTAIGADVVYGGDRAYYAPTPDRIYVRHPDQFPDADAFLATSLHEHVHWTGHRTRLDLLDLTKGFGSAEYAGEELVADLGGVSPTLWVRRDTNSPPPSQLVSSTHPPKSTLCAHPPCG